MAIEQELVRELLSEIVKSKPDIQPGDHKWLIGMLKDLYNPKRELQHSDCIKEINGIANCLFWGVVDDIRDTYGSTIEPNEAKTILRKLINQYGLQDDLSRWCIESWCFALAKKINLDAINIGFGVANHFTSKPISHGTYSYSEKVFQEIVINTLNCKQLDLDTKYELSLKGKQLSIQDEVIQSIIESAYQQLSDNRKQEIERFRNENLRIQEEKRLIQIKIDEQQKQLIEKSKQEARKHTLDGINYLKKSDYNNAIIEFNEAIRIEPKNAEAFFNLGNAFYDLKDFKNAVTAFKEATILNPKYLDAFNNLGHACFVLRHDTEAINAYQKATSINPNDAYAHFYLGNVYYTCNDYMNAIKSYKNVIRINPNSIDAHLNLAHSYFNIKDIDLSILEYKTTLTLDPNNKDAIKGLILSQNRKKQWDKM